MAWWPFQKRQPQFIKPAPKAEQVAPKPTHSKSGQPIGLLRTKFEKGELIKWKGIWFQLEGVNHDTMVLKVN